ncbi:hypothetical protein MXB_776, partial [Myxobolus squamalis]
MENLEDDFADGTKLIVLYEVLTGKTVKKFWKKPNGYFQKAENVSKALKGFREEGIKFVNIVCKSNSSAKEKLIGWVNTKLLVKNKSCRNFKSDWKDGKLLAVLVETFLPGSFDESEIEYISTPQNLCEKAIHLSDQQLGVPKLILMNEFLSEHVDEMSIMTYISFFRLVKTVEESDNSADRAFIMSSLESTDIIDESNTQEEIKITDTTTHIYESFQTEKIINTEDISLSPSISQEETQSTEESSTINDSNH